MKEYNLTEYGTYKVMVIADGYTPSEFSDEVVYEQTQTGINNVRIGEKTPVAIYSGTREAKKVYIGSALVYEKGGSSGNKVVVKGFNDIANLFDNYYSLDGGNTWTLVSSIPTTIENTTQISFKMVSKTTINDFINAQILYSNNETTPPYLAEIGIEGDTYFDTIYAGEEVLNGEMTVSENIYVYFSAGRD